MLKGMRASQTRYIYIHIYVYMCAYPSLFLSSLFTYLSHVSLFIYFVLKFFVYLSISFIFRLYFIYLFHLSVLFDFIISLSLFTYCDVCGDIFNRLVLLATRTRTLFLGNHHWLNDTKFCQVAMNLLNP